MNQPTLDWTPEELEEPELFLPPMDLPTRCQYGDIWQLGRHTLYCGDSEVSSLVNSQIKTHGLATLVFTDPPYQMSTLDGSDNCMIPKEMRPGHRAIKELEIGKYDPTKFLNILPSYFAPKTIAAFIFHSKDSTPEYYSWVRDVGKSGSLNGICVTPLVWYKSKDEETKASPIPFGKAHNNDIEYLMYIRLKGKWNNRDKAPLAHRGRCLFHERVKGEHPTIKPVALITNQILLTTDPNDLIYDPYGGSGSTLIACEQTGRRCVMTEKLPRFCDLIISRWEGESGRRAEKL